jgi:N-acetylglucosamine-6-sulfatase
MFNQPSLRKLGGDHSRRRTTNAVCRFVFLCVLGALCGGLHIGGTAELDAAQPSKPNIVFILVDDLRWDDLGCAGHPFARTPNIDRVAREGALFQNAFATAPLCSPSRGCILTGQYARAHGIIDNTDRSAQSHQLKTFPQELQKAGYKTAFIGKWHMGNDNTRRPGFDRWFCLKGQGSSFDPDVNDDGREVRTRGYVTDILNERSVEFVRRPHGEPFFLYLSHKAIHPEVYQGPDGSLSDPTLSNFIPAPRHEELFEDAAIPRRPSFGIAPTDKPALMQKLSGVPPLGPKTVSSDTAILNRLRMLASVDEGVGELLGALADTNQLDSTLFVVTSDHGYFYGEHGLSVERRLAYEESIRIPLAMRFPPLIAAGSTPDGFAITIDFAPTFVELAGSSIPRGFHGRSLLPLLKGPAPIDWRKSFLIEYYSDSVFPRMHKMGYEAVRNERWKYIRFTEQADADELYDLKDDPYELNNLVRDPESARTIATMRQELESLVAVAAD